MRTTSEVTAASPGRSSIASSGEVRVLRTLRTLFDALHGAGVHYCHWKSNWKLVEALRGERDLDLLVHRGDASRFLSVVGAVGCKPGRSDGHPSLCHYYGFDEQSGHMLDLHVYHRIITGGTIKEYHLRHESAWVRGARDQEEGECRLEDAIESGRSGVGRFRLGRALASQLRHHRRFVRPGATVARGRRAWRKAWRTLGGGGPTRALLSGGAVIGVVGSDGAGKSTLV